MDHQPYEKRLLPLTDEEPAGPEGIEHAVHRSAGNPFFLGDELGDFVLLIAREHGRSPRIIDIRGAGEILGEMGVIRIGPRMASIIAFDDAEALPGTASPLPANGQFCTMLAVDVARFTAPDRDEEIRLHIRKSLYEMLAEALKVSGIPWNSCHHEDQGDGVLTIIPPGISPCGLIDPFPFALRARIRRHNHVSCTAARMQLRVSVHTGSLHADAHGLCSDDVTYLFRMLDAPPLRRALADSGAELALAVSNSVYTSLVQRCPSLANPALFRPIRSRVKQTRVNAWLNLPGKDY